ncbi:DUF5777 family beta-barrel protein [Sphingobacterium sp. E70]|uniref:DUF5777 family beta-barrel protein n=1 Tax=Sphingobacterium sp. E70 TaxID=2853439 RepID=UPI00211BF8D2|nr:DUF5777 family beta-barrel protein [Sphingobacterium sp. E70]ULT23291.1 DUF5777 family beta-barrel protein [Sphingobacterium sp. E70]
MLSIISLKVVAQEDLDKMIKLEGPKNEKVTATFKSGNLINLKTTETIHRNEMDFRVDHRFGDIGGSAGGAKNFFGLDNSTDIRIGFDYGLTDNINIGIARAKGATEVRQLYEGNIKYRFVEQTIDNSVPVSIAFLEAQSYPRWRLRKKNIQRQVSNGSATA